MRKGYPPKPAPRAPRPPWSQSAGDWEPEGWFEKTPPPFTYFQPRRMPQSPSDDSEAAAREADDLFEDMNKSFEGGLFPRRRQEGYSPPPPGGPPSRVIRGDSLSARDLAAVIAAFALFGAAWRWLM